MNRRVRMRGALVGAVVALTFALSWSLLKVPALEDKADNAVGEVNTLKPQVQTLSDNQQKLQAGLAEANRRLVANGKAPVPVPKVDPTPAQDEFTAEEAAAVRAIVEAQLQTHVLTQAEISQIAKVAAALIPKPADGKPPSAAEVQAAVKIGIATYCLEGRCTPKPGADGKDGKDAPKVTDEELLRSARLALASYCAQDTKPCTPKDGKDAPPPYSVIDQDCIGDDDQSFWRVYVSNGTDQRTFDTAGPCRIGKAPN